jgi:DNA invertase Pin-like site-specific DNA recombinase
MTVFGYARVSTEQQAREGISLDGQQRLIGSRVQQYGLPVVDRMLIEDGVSGSIPLGRRPRGAALLAAVQPGDVVLACKLDRMFRDTRDALRTIKLFRRNRIRLYLFDLPGEVTSDIVSQMLFTIVAAFAEFERARISERIRESIAERRRQGKPIGPARYGWERRDGKHVEVPEQQAAIREICKLAADGMSHRRIGIRFGFSPHVISKIIWRATDPEGLAAYNQHRAECRRRSKQATNGPANHRTLAKPKTFGEAVAAYAQTRGLDPNGTRLSRLVTDFADRLLSEEDLPEADLQALAERLYPNGPPGTKNREVLGPAHAVLRYAAGLGWTAPRDRRRGVLFPADAGAAALHN